MKKILLLAATIFCFLNFINAQQPGQLDPSFGTNGIVKTDLGKNYGYAVLGKHVLVQSDGSLYLILQTGQYGNAQALITKRHADGSIDSGYGHNGFSANVKMNPTSAFLQSNGKIVLGGSVEEDFFGSPQYDVTLARFNADGTLDSSFSDDGINHPFSFSAGPNAIVLQNNEKQ